MNKKQANIYRKLENEKKRNQISRHHIINKASKDIFNVFHEDNTVVMNRLEHDYHHLNYENKHPLESLQQTERFMQVMSPQAKELYQQLVSMPISDFYDNRFIR
jgi:hypothetical protein